MTNTIKVGETNCPEAGLERGKQVLVTSAKKLAVADHDFTKFSLTSSVSFLINIPESITESFYMHWKGVCGAQRECLSTIISNLSQNWKVSQAVDDLSPAAVALYQWWSCMIIDWHMYPCKYPWLASFWPWTWTSSVLSAHHLTIVGKTQQSVSCQFSILVYSQLVSCGRKQLFKEALKSCNNLSSIRTLEHTTRNLRESSWMH